MTQPVAGDPTDRTNLLLVSWLKAAVVLLLCLPAILGGIVLIAVLARPGPPLPDTAFDRALAYPAKLSVGITPTSPPLTLLAIALGLWTMWRGGVRTAHGKAVAIILAVAITSTVAYFALFNTVLMALWMPRTFPR